MPGGRKGGSDKAKKRARETVAREARKAKKLAKKATQVEPEDTHGSSDEDSQSIAGSELVDCDLEFYDPRQQDYAGLRDLLQSFTDDTELDLPGLVDTIIKQVPMVQSSGYTALCGKHS